jgi:uncharacterized peroxidase-related enzyme
MPLISTVRPTEATGQVAETYSQIEQAFGQVPNAMQLFSSSPQLFQNTWGEIGYYMQHPNLSMLLLATIRMLISQDNDCEYCLDFNAGLLINQFGQTPEQIAAMRQDASQAPLEEKDKAMLLFVLKSVNTPKEVTAEDVEALRALGWEDGDILDATAHGARHVAIDTLFNAFKIEKDF